MFSFGITCFKQLSCQEIYLRCSGYHDDKGNVFHLSIFLLFPLFFLSSWCTTYFLFRDISLAMFRGELLVPNSHSFPVSENVFISPPIAENILLDIKFQFTVIFLQSLEKCYDTSFGSIISDGKSTSFKLFPPPKIRWDFFLVNYKTVSFSSVFRSLIIK